MLYPRLGFGDERLAVKAQFGGAGLPALDQRGAIFDHKFGIAGIERDLLLGGQSGGTGFGDLGLDLGSAG